MKTLMVTLILCGGLGLYAQDMKCPMHDQHMKSAHQSSVEKNGDQAMGFSHEKTTHHFRLLPDGGAIEVTVNDPNDTDDLQAIRMHLKHIVLMFSNGDFSIPMFVHSEVPPGTVAMKDRQADITYTFEEMSSGGRVRIVTQNRDALNAIHDFLNFQIQDHHTGDKAD
jgi:TusA-related sulfurtransferase